MHENYNYIFWNNTFIDTWYAIPRDKAQEFFSGEHEKVAGVLSDKSIDNLIKKIKR